MWGKSGKSRKDEAQGYDLIFEWVVVPCTDIGRRHEEKAVGKITFGRADPEVPDQLGAQICSLGHESGLKIQHQVYFTSSTSTK